MTTVQEKTPSTDPAQEANIEAILRIQPLITIGIDQGRDQGNQLQHIKELRVTVGKIQTVKTKMTFKIPNSEKEEDQKIEIQPDQGRNLLIDFIQRIGTTGKSILRTDWNPTRQGVTLIRRVDIVSIRILVLVRKIFVILLIMTMCVD